MTYNKMYYNVSSFELANHVAKFMEHPDVEHTLLSVDDATNGLALQDPETPYLYSVTFKSPNSDESIKIGRDVIDIVAPIPRLRVGFENSPAYGGSEPTGFFSSNIQNVPYVNMFLESGVTASGIVYFEILIFNHDESSFFGSLFFDSVSAHGITTVASVLLSNSQYPEIRDPSVPDNVFQPYPILTSASFQSNGEGRTAVASSFPDSNAEFAFDQPLVGDNKTPENLVFVVGDQGVPLDAGDIVTLDNGSGPETYIFMPGMTGPNPQLTAFFNDYVENGLLFRIKL